MFKGLNMFRPKTPIGVSIFPLRSYCVLHLLATSINLSGPTVITNHNKVALEAKSEFGTVEA